MPSQSVLVIGGGLAGLASAVALAEAGFRVRLLEKRPHLGGRATSYTLPDGSEVDNCQHVTLGCCTNLSDFYRRAGAGGRIRFYDRLYFADRRGRCSTIEASWLAPPLHMAPSFLSFGALTLADKGSIARALLTIAWAGGRPRGIESISMLDWLRRMKQTTGAIERFWRVVLVSALDEELERTLRDLRASGVDLLTLGQYLRPSPTHAPVERYVPPEEFDRWRSVGLALGFAGVEAGPLVRSSYRAEELYRRAREARGA